MGIRPDHDISSTPKVEERGRDRRTCVKALDAAAPEALRNWMGQAKWRKSRTPGMSGPVC